MKNQIEFFPTVIEDTEDGKGRETKRKGSFSAQQIDPISFKRALEILGLDDGDLLSLLETDKIHSFRRITYGPGEAPLHYEDIPSGEANYEPLWPWEHRSSDEVIYEPLWPWEYRSPDEVHYEPLWPWEYRSLDTEDLKKLYFCHAELEEIADKARREEDARKAKRTKNIKIIDLIGIMAHEEGYTSILPKLRKKFLPRSCWIGPREYVGKDRAGEDDEKWVEPDDLLQTPEGRFYYWLNLIRRWAGLEADSIKEKLPPISYLPCYLHDSKTGELKPVDRNGATSRGLMRHYVKLFVKLKEFKECIEYVDHVYQIQIPLPESLFPESDEIEELNTPAIINPNLISTETDEDQKKFASDLGKRGARRRWTAHKKLMDKALNLADGKWADGDEALHNEMAEYITGLPEFRKLRENKKALIRALRPVADRYGRKRGVKGVKKENK